MKYIIKILFLILCIGIGTNISSANYDVVRGETYGAWINGPYIIGVNTENTACGTEKEYSADLLPILSISGSSCSKVNTTTIYCESGNRIENLDIAVQNSQIISALNIPSNVISIPPGIYAQSFSIKLGLSNQIRCDNNFSCRDTTYEIKDKFTYTFSQLGGTFPLFGGDNTIRYSDPSQCTELLCGNDILDVGEECDDGNASSGDGCDNTCKSESYPICGNSTLEFGEICDDGNTNAGDGCDPSCQNEPSAGICGDNSIDVGETCDDGNTSSGDGCSNNCQVEGGDPYCGNGIKEVGEQCDDGNNINADGCTNVCETKSTGDPYCGNGIKEVGEQCDDGNNINADGCTNVCETKSTGDPYCGNGIKEVGEQCDDGNNINADGCTNVCETKSTGDPYCGNGIKEIGEQCDDGNNINADGCTNVCETKSTGDPYCGNGIKEVGEQCDDGNNINADGCTNVCETKSTGDPYCGNGIKEVGEQCDDGNNINADGCTNVCETKSTGGGKCGDGLVNRGEQCDDGNLINGDNCNASCQDEPSVGPPKCGNGIKEIGETCDDNNTINGDGCNNTCQKEPFVGRCGNGIVDFAEECDDGNTTNGDQCNSECLISIISIPKEPREPICTSTPCFTDNIVPAIINSVALGGCTLEGEYTNSNTGKIEGEYTCYAQEELDILIDVKQLGLNPKSIDHLYLAINNASNTAAIEGWIDKDINNINRVGIHTVPHESMGGFFTKAGSYTLEVQGKGIVDNSSTFTEVFNVKLNIIPNNNLKAVSPQFSETELFANNSDTTTVSLQIVDSYNNKLDKTYTLSESAQSNIFNSIINGIKLDQIANTGEALEIGGLSIVNGILSIPMQSRAPAWKDLGFSLKIPTHEQSKDLALDGDYTNGNTVSTPRINFKKPHTAEFTADSIPEVMTTKKYGIDISEHGTHVPSIASINTSINSFDLDAGYQLFNFTDLGNYEFSMRIDAITDDALLEAFSLKTNTNFWVSNSLGAKYVLTTGNAGDNDTALSTTSAKRTTLGVKIVGSASVDGNIKSIESGNLSNYVDTPKALLRKKIQEEVNSYGVIPTGTTLSSKKVHYIDDGSDYTFDGTNIDFETLIVKNGNVIINKNITTPVRILVIKNNYNLLNDYIQSGNIYVSPEVSYINANIYADGAVMSLENPSNYGTDAFYNDSLERTNGLTKQLVLKGSLFTRNTIGGATANTYTLPGTQTADTFSEAMRFDLNYLRTGNQDWQGVDTTVIGNQNNLGHKDPFVIIYNPKM